MQMHLLVFVSAGCPCIMLCGLPGIHGAVTAGMQGMGVSTPMAAAVAEATVGLLRVLHMPKGMMFTIGAKSMMLARGMLPINLVRDGRTMSDDGARPKVHVIMAPLTTKDSPIYDLRIEN